MINKDILFYRHHVYESTVCFFASRTNALSVTDFKTLVRAEVS